MEYGSNMAISYCPLTYLLFYSGFFIKDEPFITEDNDLSWDLDNWDDGGDVDVNINISEFVQFLTQLNREFSTQSANSSLENGFGKSFFI